MDGHSTRSRAEGRIGAPSGQHVDIAIEASIRRLYADAYRDGASGWRTAGATDKAKNIVRLCAAIPHATIVDVGAGDGAVLQALAASSFGQAYHALEIAESAVAAIRLRNIPALNAAVVFDGYRIPFDDDRFDVAILSHVVEHVEHPRRLLREAARIARHLFVEVPLEDNARLPLDYTASATGHINFFSRKTLRRLVQTTGLTVVDELVSLPSARVHTFHAKSRIVNYCLKYAALALSARLATHVFTYHYSVLTRLPDSIAD